MKVLARLGIVASEPKKVFIGNLCYTNEGLKTLKDLNLPEIVRGIFWCDGNKLTSLEGAPKEVSKSFICIHNKLTSLKGAPEKVGIDFYCYGNPLVSLEGCPKVLGGDFVISKSCGFTEEDIRKICKVKGEVVLV